MKKIINILIVSMLFFVATVNVNAIEFFTKEDIICTETESYVKWKKMPESKRKEFIQPIRCKESFGKLKKIKLGDGMPSPIGGVDPFTATEFDLRDYGYVSPMKNQETTNLCWTFATNEVIESNYKVFNEGKSIDLSEKHMDYNIAKTYTDLTTNPYKLYPERDLNEGGNYIMSSLYLASGRGGVKESRLPWSTTTSTPENAHLKNDYYVNQTRLFLGDQCHDDDSLMINTIKLSLVTTGAVGATAYAYIEHFSDNSHSYYYSGTENANHAIAIVGWDDNYSASNFKTTPPGDGAWLIKDQQGADFGDGGYYYLSYYDSNICGQAFVVNDVTEANDNNYYYDLGLFWEQSIGAPNDTIYFKTSFDKKTDYAEILKKVNIFAFPGDQYKIYYSESGNINDVLLLGEGTSAGYNNITIDVTENINISDKYNIILEYTSSLFEAGNYYFPLDYIPSQRSAETVTGGRGYYSADGTQWLDSITSREDLKFYPMIRAFTDNDARKIEVGEPIPSSENVDNINGGEFTIPITLTNIDSTADLSLKIYNSSNTDVTSKFTVTTLTNEFKVAVKLGETSPGNYNVVISTIDGLVSLTTTIVVGGISDVLITSITLEGKTEVSIEGTLLLTAVINPSNATNKTLNWTSSDTNIATVSNGTVTGSKQGEVTITATATDGSNQSASLVISVIDTRTANSTPSPTTTTNTPTTGSTEELPANPHTNIIQFTIIGTITILCAGVIIYIVRKNNKFKSL